MLNVEDNNGQVPDVRKFWGRIAQIHQGLMEELTGSYYQERPALWTESLLRKPGLSLPAGQLVVEGLGKGYDKIQQAV